MSTMRGARFLAVASVALVLSGCGGDDPPGRTADRDRPTSTTAPAGSTSTTGADPATTTTAGPGGPVAPGGADDGLRALDGSVRLANFYVGRDHRGLGVDAYWGNDARADRKITTVGFGKVSGVQDARGTGVSGADGAPPELVVSFFLQGRTTEADRVATVSTDYGPGFRFIVELSWGRTFGASTGGVQPAATQVIREHDVGTPRAGTAAVIVNNLGVLAIGDGTPLQLGPAAACGSWPSISEEYDNGNAGESSFEVAPGEVQVTAFDRSCAAASSPTRLRVRAGDRVVVFVYGADAASRRLLPLVLTGR